MSSTKRRSQSEMEQRIHKACMQLQNESEEWEDPDRIVSLEYPLSMTRMTN